MTSLSWHLPPSGLRVICPPDVLPRECFCLLGSAWCGCCGETAEACLARGLLIPAVHPHGHWCYSGVSTATKGLWGLKGMEIWMVFTSVLPVKGKGCEQLQDHAGQHLYWQQGPVVDCGTFFVEQEVLERDPLNKTGWEHLFWQTE